jgi:hypothetical protein
MPMNWASARVRTSTNSTLPFLDLIKAGVCFGIRYMPAFERCPRAPRRIDLLRVGRQGVPRASAARQAANFIDPPDSSFERAMRRPAEPIIIEIDAHKYGARAISI